MFRNRNFNFALIVFVMTLTALIALIEYYPAEQGVDDQVKQESLVGASEKTLTARSN